MSFKIIVAMDNNNGIGKNNTLPWYLPEDLNYFAKKTKGNGNNAIIMGRKTYESIGRALSKRTSYVLSRTICKKEKNPKLHIYDNLDELLSAVKSANHDELWIIGGAEIYNIFLKANMVSHIYITKINENYNCDTFFPNIQQKENNLDFKLLEEKENKSSNNSITYTLCEYVNNNTNYLS